jgi:hypothetical protein
LKRLGDSWFLAIAATIFVSQQVAIRLMPADGLAGGVRRTIFFATTALLVGLALHFRRFWGAWLVAAGILMNLIPMAAHGGSMPIDYEIIAESGAFPDVTRDDIGKQSSYGKDIVLEREDIHFYTLSDRYVVELPAYGANIYSLGDFILFAGLGLIVIQAVWTLAVPGNRGRPDEAGHPETPTTQNPASLSE